MPWLKKNLTLVVSGVIALALLGFAGFFLYSKLTGESEVSGQLTAQTEELDRLSKLNPHPGTEKVNNIDAAKRQDKELKDFLAEARKTFLPLSYPTGIDSGQFRLLMDTTFDELHRSAQASGVKLTAGYAFTFASQKSQMNFEPNVLEPLVIALSDIREVCQMLFRAKVLTLDGIRRVPIMTQDTPGSGPAADIWNKKPFTNDLAISTPYEFTFHSFTPELAAVLEELYSSPHCFIVKNVVVDTAPSQLLQAEAAPVLPAAIPMSPGFGGMDMRMRMRYGLLMQPTPQAAPTPTPARGGLTPMVDEKPFRVIMWVEALRLKEVKEGAPPAREPRAPRPIPEAASASN